MDFRPGGAGRGGNTYLSVDFASDKLCCCLSFFLEGCLAIDFVFKLLTTNLYFYSLARLKKFFYDAVTFSRIYELKSELLLTIVED